MAYSVIFSIFVNPLPPQEGSPPFDPIPRVANTTTDVPSDSPDFNLDGKHLVLGVSSHSIVLSNPGGDWDRIGSGIYTRYSYPILDVNGPRWIGPFTMDVEDMDSIVTNFVAPNGLFADNGNDVYPLNIGVAVEITPIDENGAETGPPVLYPGTLIGSNSDRSQRALTLISTAFGSDPISQASGLPFKSRAKVRAHRTTASIAFVGSVIDEVRWRDLYSSSSVDQTDFGNVTTIQTITYATTGALVVKERKLNLLVSRKIQRGSFVNGVFTLSTQLSTTDQIDDILASLCLDPYIGRRKPEEIDFQNIYDTIAAVRSYFGTSRVTSFNYTFDQENTSFEESIASVVSDAFCTAYRRGSSIRIAFEKKTADSVLLFNHRNKVPGSEQRSVTFGNVEDFDGIELTFVDPVDDAIVTYYMPANKTATSPKKVESVGIRSVLQAHFHACRLWNKLRYQNTAVEFEATQEASLLAPSDRILVADNTRPETVDGEIIGQNGLELELSQKIDYTDAGRTRYIFLQHIDGSVESIQLAGPGSAPNRVILHNAPKLPLAVDSGNYARATFTIVTESPPQSQTFLLSEKDAKDNFTMTVKAVNYDDRYYDNDLDFINGIVVDG
jgi:hypothetical protein